MSTLEIAAARCVRVAVVVVVEVIVCAGQRHPSARGEERRFQRGSWFNSTYSHELLLHPGNRERLGIIRGCSLEVGAEERSSHAQVPGRRCYQMWIGYELGGDHYFHPKFKITTL